MKFLRGLWSQACIVRHPRSPGGFSFFNSPLSCASVCLFAGVVGLGFFARAGGTLVILMGVAQRGVIATALIDGGLAAETPVAASRNATGAEQEVLRCPLAPLAAAPVRSPATLVVGAVAGFDVLAGHPDALDAQRRH